MIQTLISLFFSLRHEYEPRLVGQLLGGYDKASFVKDLLAGLTVAIVALPLSMAIAIASGVSPDKGIFTAIVAGFFISFLGGSKYQVGGPTAAFTVTVALVIAKHGYDGLALATIMAGIMLIIFGLARAGELIKFIPYPVVTGFTSGIALLIFFSQIKDFFGLAIDHIPIDFLQKLVVYASNMDTINPYSAVIAVTSVLIIIACQKLTPKIPGPLVVVVLGSIAVYLFGLPVDTIESRFGQIPSMLPSPSLPDFSFAKARAVLPDAITIAVLAGIESLLSAVVADGMTGSRHKSNAELIGQGVSNIASIMFGGIPATGAIARTATNIKAGAISPISGIAHALWLLLFMLALTPLIVKVPLAALSGILTVIAWNMSEIKHIRIIMRSPRSDRFVLFVTFALTVLVDLNFAVQVGISLASIIFIHKMSQAGSVTAYKADDEYMGVRGYDDDAIRNKSVPPGVEVYEVVGPLFFGVADKFKDTLLLMDKPPKVFILRMRYVPIMDAAGLHALCELHKGLANNGTTLVLSGVKDDIKILLDKYQLLERIGRDNVTNHIDKALIRASNIVSSCSLT
jgi:sulfate permease, SulP family